MCTLWKKNEQQSFVLTRSMQIEGKSRVTERETELITVLLLLSFYSTRLGQVQDSLGSKEAGCLMLDVRLRTSYDGKGVLWVKLWIEGEYCNKISFFYFIF